MNFFQLMVPTIGFLVTLQFVHADKHTALCPSGYPRQVSYEKTGKCHPVGQQGPCGKLMTMRSNPMKPNTGYCACKDMGTSYCLGRPLIYWPSKDRCYFAYSQGPCRKGQWLITSKYGQLKCSKNPCPVNENERDLLRAEYSTEDFYFALSNQCYLTGTRSFCEKGEQVYFLGTDPHPTCTPYRPWSCDGESAFVRSDTDGGGGFGIPFDDI